MTFNFLCQQIWFICHLHVETICDSEVKANKCTSRRDAHYVVRGLEAGVTRHLCTQRYRTYNTYIKYVDENTGSGEMVAFEIRNWESVEIWHRVCQLMSYKTHTTNRALLLYIYFGNWFIIIWRLKNVYIRKPVS